MLKPRSSRMFWSLYLTRKHVLLSICLNTDFHKQIFRVLWRWSLIRMVSAVLCMVTHAKHIIYDIHAMFALLLIFYYQKWCKMPCIYRIGQPFDWLKRAYFQRLDIIVDRSCVIVGRYIQFMLWYTADRRMGVP